MDVSFELLSSMSPKIDQKKKKKCKRGSATVLALKHHFRRSSIFDKSQRTEKNDSLILIEPSSTDSSSYTDSGKDLRIINETPIIISDSEGNDSDTSIYDDGEGALNSRNISDYVQTRKNSKSLEMQLEKNCYLSYRKINDIEHWIETVSDLESKFSELSTIYGEEYKSEGSNCAANSTFIDAASKKFDELFKGEVSDRLPKKEFISNESLEDPLKLDDEEAYTSALSNPSNAIDDNKNSICDISSSLQNFSIDDSLDVPDTQNLHSENIEKLNTDTFPRHVENRTGSLENKQKETHSFTKAVYKKSPNYHEDDLGGVKNNSQDSYIEDSLVDSFSQNINSEDKGKVEDADASLKNAKNKIDLQDKREVSNVDTPLNNRFIKGESIKNRNHYMNPLDVSSDSENNEIGGQQESNKNDSLNSPTEIKSLLDEIYGNSWRQNENAILPVSERKPRRILTENDIKNQAKTDVQPKPSFAYKNTYLATATSKSNNLLQKLQRSKIRAAVESPWVSKLKSLCDPDSSLEESESQILHPIKLDFEKDDSSKSRYRSTKEIILSSESDKENEDIGDPEDILKDKRKKKINNFRINTNHIVQKKKKQPEKKVISKANEHGSYSFLASLSGNVPITKCDMSARIYRNNFKQFKDQLVKKLFTLYNTNIFDNKLPCDMEIKWNDRLRGTAGRCDCKKITRRTGAIERKAQILLSTKILDSADRLRDTLIHEMCHAATWIINQIADGHGSFWKSWAHKAVKVFPELPAIERCHRYDIKTKYTYKCTSCGYSIGRHTKSLDIERKRCGYCHGTFEVLLNKANKHGEVKSVPATPKSKNVTGFALFVKENYATHKTHQLSHAEVMRLLGQKFAELKT